MIIFQSIIKELDVTINKYIYYIATGNDKEQGYRLVGNNVRYIRMKKAAGSTEASFWLDDTFEANIMKFDEDVKAVKTLAQKGANIIYSPALLGEDLKKMKTFCPKTADHMDQKLGDLLKIT
jgi:hypothetical protein